MAASLDTDAAGTSRRTFVHVATLALDPGGDVRAPGAAITLRL
ncbi:hypothetical protein [Modestobacter sp. URMC 112]